ncbi:MAG: hypothetical protein M1814_003004 [Vezdaea aestivalis]|nr:MAG: hypothetical protein M1814_003004 [Vezdaea aestivalis]
MEAYPPEYVDHNLPLVLLTGLRSKDGSAKPSEDSADLEGGTLLHCDIPEVESSHAQALLKLFLREDSSNAPWNAKTARTTPPFRVKAIGRNYILPCRKAAPPSPHTSPSPPSSPQSAASKRYSPPVLHSPLSPLSPLSPTFPDGLMTPKWVKKHQDSIPSCFIIFITLYSEDSPDSIDDATIQAEVLKLKNGMASFKYKGRFCVVAIGEESANRAVELDRRIESLRRGCGLDNKQFIFVPPDVSQVELEVLVREVMKSIEPSCIEYYRELSKHSRRKRNRGSIPAPTAPPTSGTSQTLSSQGWGIRYLFKLGVFAEFRQEMDAAGRNYNEAYDSLFSQDLFGSIASWSPRWNEARLLADILAIRMIRCHLWNEQTTNAVKRWRLHRVNMEKMVDERGKGSSTYGWQAWESTWATVMADLIKRSQIPKFSGESEDTDDSKSLFMPPEKAIPLGERIHPQEFLHHPGYWYRIAVKYSKARRKLAREIPEEDRGSPGQSPASRVANRSYIYDTYLCPEPHIESPLPGQPGYDHGGQLTTLLDLAFEQYKLFSQSRSNDELQLALGKEELMRRRWRSALQILRPLWQDCKWRKEAWWLPLSELCWALAESAAEAGDGGSVISARWELLSDLHLSFSFQSPKGHVGNAIPAQIWITSNAQQSSAPITLSEVMIDFAGCLKQIILRHHDSERSQYHNIYSQDVELTIGPSSTSTSSPPGSPRPLGRMHLIGQANLTIGPGETEVFNVNIPLREDGEGSVTSGTLCIAEDLFDIEYITDLSSSECFRWELVSNRLRKTRIARNNPPMIVVLPRPPKLQLTMKNMRACYYTNEYISLDLQLLNEEEATSVVTLEARLKGEIEHGMTLSWRDSLVESESAALVDETDAPGVRTRIQSNLEVGEIAAGKSKGSLLQISPIEMQTEIVVEIKAVYYLQTDPTTLIPKNINILLPIVGPLDANYDFSPRVCSDRWPDYFHFASKEELESDDEIKAPKGLKQQWNLTAHVTSFASDTFIIESIDYQVRNLEGGGSCHSQKSLATLSPRKVLPEEVVTESFDITIQKDRIEHRKTNSVDGVLIVKWRRDEEGAAVQSTPLQVPRFHVPIGEPRVLASSQTSDAIEGLIHLDYTFENPTMHLLTFHLSMEPNEDFAFSGLRTSTLQLVPLSRETIRYNMIPYVNGVWIKPVLKVVDPYFNKTLPVSGTEGMKSDKKEFHLLAGLTSGLSTSILLQPADLLKTRLQQSHAASLLPTIRSLLASPQPLRAFYRGTLPSALRTGLGSALYFATLNKLRERAAVLAPAGPGKRRGDGKTAATSALPALGLPANLLTGAVARGAVGWIMMPVTVVKVRFESSLYAYEGLRKAGSAIWAKEGVQGFFKGSVATLVRDAPYAGLYVGFYEGGKGWMGRALERRRNGKLSSREAAGVNFIAGGVAAGAATLVTNPVDAVKTRVQLVPEKYGGVVKAGLKMVREEGWNVLFDGLGLRMGRKALSSALAWTLYEELIRRAEGRFIEGKG